MVTTAFTLTSSGASIVKAGENASSKITLSGARVDEFSLQSEGRICAETRRDWVTNYSDLSTCLKNILDDVSSSLIAKQIIAFDMSGYDSIAEAQTLLDVHDDTAREGLRILRDFKSNEIKTP